MRKRIALLPVLLGVLLGAHAAAAVERDGIAGKRHLVTRTATPDGGTLSFYVGRWERDRSDACLLVERRLKGDGPASRPSSFENCGGGVPSRGKTLASGYHTDFERPEGGETLLSGVTVTRAHRIRVRMRDGRNLRARLFRSPEGFSYRAKFFLLRIAGTGGIAAVRSVDRSGRTLGFHRFTAMPR